MARWLIETRDALLELGTRTVELKAGAGAFCYTCLSMAPNVWVTNGSSDLLRPTFNAEKYAFSVVFGDQPW